MTDRPIRIPILGVSAAFLIAIVSGCMTVRSGPVSVRTDSAGVQLITYSGTPDSLGIVGSFDFSDRISVGGADDVRAPSFSRIIGGGFLPNGDSFVVDGASAQVFIFSQSGEIEGSFGTQGDGPGELSSIFAAGPLAGDSIWVWDGVRQRVLMYALDGSFGRAVAIDPERPDRYSALLRSSTGGYIATDRWRAPGQELRSTNVHLERDSVVVVSMSEAGTLLDTIGVFPSSEAIRGVEVTGGIVRTREASRPFSRSFRFALDSEGSLVGGISDGLEVHWWDRSGRLLRSTRFPDHSSPITPGVLERWLDAGLSSVSNPEAVREGRQQLITEFDVPDFTPAFEALNVTTSGEVWITRYRVDRSDAPEWIVWTIGSWGTDWTASTCRSWIGWESLAEPPLRSEEADRGP